MTAEAWAPQNTPPRINGTASSGFWAISIRRVVVGSPSISRSRSSVGCALVL